MKVVSYKFGIGVTFLELLVAVAVLAILVSIVVGVSSYVDRSGQVKLTEEAIGTVVSALEEYHDYYGKFPFEADAGYVESDLINDLSADSITGDHNDLCASSEALYYFLHKTPVSRKIINELSDRLIAGKGDDGLALEIVIDPDVLPLMRFIDSWKMPLRYTYEQDDNFPLIVSAGPDRKFDTRDDIKSTGR